MGGDFCSILTLERISSLKEKKMSVKFVDHSWLELKEFINRNALILMPVGAIEEHGPHLPVSTDMVIASRLAEAVANRIKDQVPVLITPDMWQAYNGNILHQWPGSLTISQDTQKRLLYEIAESIIKMGFKKILFINSHGQNLFTLEAVCRQIADDYGVYLPFVFEYKIAADFMGEHRKSKIGGISHACEFETSMMLQLTDLVNMSKAEKSLMTYSSKFKNNDGMQGTSRVFWSTWALEKAEMGVLGDPTTATEETGAKAFEYLVGEISEFALEYYHYGKPK